MKILFLYKYIKTYDFDNWLNLKFIEYFKNHFPEHEVYAYGPNIHEAYPDLVREKYNPNLSSQDLKSIFNFDCVIINTKSRMFEYYNPHAMKYAGEWTPKGFHYLNVPKIVLEQDYHYEHNDLWYQQQNITLILQRHYNSVKRKEVIPMKWLPFSVDINTFHSTPLPRMNKIGFAGTSNSAYPDRQSIINFFVEKGMIDCFSRKEKIGQEYLDFLKRYVIILSGLSKYNITPAKMFEIMASGAILLTNNDGHLKELFPDGSYLEYKGDSVYSFNSSLKEVNSLFANQQEMKRISDKGIQCIKEKHTHDIRIKEMINMIINLNKT